ncbi:MAG: hypothetical protein RMJ51_01845 [Candidatus Calescibacterium sp.]|nr:hypothetical protein [Candidatus Calescibacterium sp.]MCX7971930.1 hypothetical protein [bacterium]MDW8194971.1 hypothetical protein [Candidatus Calescibacterium sp.]
MPYRPCKYRHSQLGIFQCERHMYQHTTQEQYEELYHFCLKNVPDKFCPYIDFGFDMSQDPPKININCTHPYFGGPLKAIGDCPNCPFPEGDSLA